MTKEGEGDIRARRELGDPLSHRGDCYAGFNYSCPDSIPASSTSISLRYFQLLHILMQLSENEAIPPLNEPGQIALA